MAPSATHRGWLTKHNEGILAAVYNGAMPGTTLLASNTALDGVLLGTPVTPALAVDSLVISNMVASGDFLLATNSGGNSQAWIWVDTSAGLMTLYRQGVSALELGAGIVFNEASADRDFRVETDGMAYAIYADGAKNALVLGGNTDTSSADQLITVSRIARTATANTNYFDLALAPAGAVTVPAGTTAVVATVSIAEPNITSTGTTTRAATLYIASQPTEGGTANAAILFGAAANIACTTSLTFNEDSEDIDFRFESNGMAYAIYSDGGKDALVLGSNTDTSSVDQLITVSRAARTATANTAYYDLAIQPAGAVTVPTGTTAVVASLMIAEPNITATGTVTNACTVYISGVPTEGGTGNYGLFIDAGGARIDGDLTLSDAAMDIIMKAATAAALEISDGTTKFVAFDTRVATVGVTTATFNISAYTLASASNAVATGWSFAAHTLNLTGNTQVTSEAISTNIGARTIAADGAGGACTVDKASSLKIVAPTEGSNVTLTAASAIRIGDGGGTPVNQYGIFIETLTAGATADYAIWVAGPNAVHLGTEGAATGLLEISGATSGTCSITAAASTTSFTMTLPAAANTNAGYQLTCAAGDTITSWGAAASHRELKDIIGEHEAQDALDKILGTRVYDFHYKPGKGTQDGKTTYVGVMADEAPWAMHYEGGVVNPVNALGFTVLGFQAMARRIEHLEAQVVSLSKGKSRNN